MGKLTGKTAVITGGNSGIGLATVKLFLAEGARVVLSGRRQEALDELASQLDGDFITVLADASKVEENEKLIKTAVEKYGSIDILFLNAGIAPFAPAELITEELYDQLMNTNVKGPLFTVKSAIPHLNEGGVIIFNTSIVHLKGFGGSGIYSATKAALRAYTRVLATELKEKKIRAVSVAPGPIETPIYSKIGMTEDQLKELGTSFAQQVPLGRFGKAEELAQSVLFLASDDASFVNGVELAVDGGLSQV